MQERSLDPLTMSPAKLVPDDREDMTEWLWVDLQPELGRALVYIRDDVSEGERTTLEAAPAATTAEVPVDEPTAGAVEDVGPLELVLRLQGLIADMNMNVGGDWDG